MATSEAKEIKKQETLVRFSIISYKTRLRSVNQGVGVVFPLPIYVVYGELFVNFC